MSILLILPFTIMSIVNIIGRKDNTKEKSINLKKDNWRKKYSKIIEEMWNEQTFIRQQLDVSTTDCEQCSTNERICKCAKKQFLAHLSLENVRKWNNITLDIVKENLDKSWHYD